MSSPSDIGTSRRGTPRSWSSTASALTALKEEFIEWATTAQEHRCAFCILPVGHHRARRGHDIDHFAPKSLHQAWTFEVLNWILTCSSCNQYFKKSTNTVVAVSTPYENSIFLIVHPYLDTVSNHLIGGYFDDLHEPSPIKALDIKGEETVKMFNLSSPGLFQLWGREFREAKRALLPEDVRAQLDRILNDEI